MNTSTYWLQKVFLILREYQKDILLKKEVYIDEMFYTVIKSDLKTKDGKKLRGISHNQYCIGIGIGYSWKCSIFEIQVYVGR